MNKEDIIIAQATPFGTGGISVIRVSGKGSIELVQRHFSNKKLSEADSHTIHFGTIRDKKDNILDECLVSLFKCPASYTKEDTIEISCHGSPYITSEITKTLIESGARHAEGGEFTLRAFLNGQLNLSQAEAVADLISAENYYSHKLALDQLRGGYADDLVQMRQKLIEFASLIELELDFGEEDVEFASRTDVITMVDKLAAKLSGLVESFDLGNSLKNGIPVVIAGQPNAGKSTLLNALMNSDRAIVSDIPGTTRDTIDDTLIIEGVKFILTDTAGIREAENVIEKMGIEKTYDKIKTSQVLLYVIDVTTQSPEDTWKDLSQFDNNKATLLILNKMDLYPTIKPESFINQSLIKENNILPISAIRKANIPVIKEKLLELVSLSKAKDTSVVTNTRHFEALTNALDSLKNVKEALNNNISGDLLSIDIKQALYHIGLVTGEIHTDDLLESIFSNFCIGK